MNIVKASPEYAEFIAENLSLYFTSLNSHFGYNKYKTDKEKIFEHITNRLQEENSEFQYFVTVTETNEPIGFVNTVSTPMVFEIIALKLLPAYDTLENTKELLTFAIDTLKSQGADKILTEVSTPDKNFTLALNEINATLVEQKFLIS